jgi:hypothetical protein
MVGVFSHKREELPKTLILRIHTLEKLDQKGTIRDIVWNSVYVVIVGVKEIDFVCHEKLLLTVVVSVLIFKAVGVEIVKPPEELGQLGIVEGLGNKPVNGTYLKGDYVHILCLRRGKGGRYQSSE